MKRIFCVLLCLALCLCAGCSADTKQTKTIFAMDTVMELTVWGKDGQLAIEQVDSLLTQLEKKWSCKEADSLLSQLNRGEEPALTEEEKTLLKDIDALSGVTGGAFDPKLGAVSQLWGFTEDVHSVPSAVAIADAIAMEQWDLGAAIKGYAGQQAVSILEELDVDRALLNLGGNVQTYGEKPDGTAWNIGIQNPDGGDTIGVVAVQGTASIVTSGDYQRFFEADGVRYHHIIDPETGCPADSGLRSVTVICTDGLKADVLSTALFVMGLEKGADFWRQSGDFEAVFITADGTIYATAGVALSGCEYEVIGHEN